MQNPGPTFIIPEPAPGDTRPRNAFGILTGFGKAYAAEHRARDRQAAATATHADYRIVPARYAKRMMAVHDTSDGSGWKSRAARILCALKARWTGREKAYILSPSKAIRFIKLYADGWDATNVTRELVAPEAEVPSC